MLALFTDPELLASFALPESRHAMCGQLARLFVLTEARGGVNFASLDGEVANAKARPQGECGVCQPGARREFLTRYASPAALMELLNAMIEADAPKGDTEMVRPVLEEACWLA